MIENTWNVIFLCINILSENNDDNVTVDNGVLKFINDVRSTPYSKTLNISLLLFSNPIPVGIAEVYQTNQGPDNNHSFFLKEKRDFDCQDESSYSGFYTSLIKNLNENNKYLIVFLAHSFGAGFFYFESKYFTTINFRNSLKTAFGNTQIDCLMALNCEIQSVESNIIFKDTVTLLIGSQRPLYVKSISYKELLSDLTQYSYWNDEIIFSKFLYNCFSFYSSFFRHGEEYLFSLTLSKPKNARILLVALNALSSLFDLKNEAGKLLNKRDIDLLGNVRAFCYDPSYSDKINIFDAHVFFYKVKELFHASEIIVVAADFIIELLNKVIVLFLASEDAYKFDKISKPKKIFLGNGLGLFIPKVDSLNLDVIFTIYSFIYGNESSELIKLGDGDWNDLIENFIKHLSIINISIKKTDFDISKIDEKLIKKIQEKVELFLKI